MSELFGDRLFNALERTDPAPGMLLVAAPGLVAGEFTRSVVFVIEHGDTGTFGVNLVARSELAVDEVMPEWLAITAKPKALYVGGPLSRDTVLCVGVTKNGVDPSDNPQLTRCANRIVYVNGAADPAELATQLDGVRLFAGFAEWAPGQLDEEIARGDWYIAPALPGDILAPGPADLWSDVMRRQPAPLPAFATFPVDPRDN
ncbi:YqgE/AlgH family protein [Corynebacterium sp. CCM 8835]|uniref:YqgE/AlgH family protein n=1 Tax=Corynebacterium antarcticum TaxID=2800405 RepID=A0ABS1FLI5_9CORY|nr:MULTISPECIES: YqgE/AlgH family protein [Corynebacterium]MBV7293795.1 YqgE/AlgH family protein [Corynebacterium sp. TAE3-ERU16]MCK7642674.1 YqgE/AlgH family protein [Corynebacterium antarcticum]MCK7660638.1 YqgE/AlgH family protein [Corynebacterium antarcticum]MCL0245384.1 YqgE/AlgH family protein [Corynebacterium antarcticum]MCX7492161.1 YqgE/AlgH family protein [Corynebacterium antarcticum]